MVEYRKSKKLDGVCYDIRGPVMERAVELETRGHRILKLNIGNPAAFDFHVPEDMTKDMIANLAQAEGYCDSKGLFPARKAVILDFQEKGISEPGVDDVYIGNGVSELILMSMQALLNDGDEVLVPAPDYPLWTAAATLSGGTVRHYLCDEESSWYPDLQDMESKITDRTKGIVVINPNNPTGAVYPEEILSAIAELARRHGLMLFCDEIYEKVLYDGTIHVPMARVAPDLPCVSFSGLSKGYRAAGFRSGWMVLTGPHEPLRDYRVGLDILANMRLCANVPAQLVIQTALGGYQSIEDLFLPTGRLGRQRDAAYDALTSIDGITCVKPKGALYLFPKVDINRFGIDDDVSLVLKILEEEHILLVQGTGFNWPKPDHFRIVFLPHEDELKVAMRKLSGFFGRL